MDRETDGVLSGDCFGSLPRAQQELIFSDFYWKVMHQVSLTPGEEKEERKVAMKKIEEAYVEWDKEIDKLKDQALKDKEAAEKKANEDAKSKPLAIQSGSSAQPTSSVQASSAAAASESSASESSVLK